jgi:ATP-dependent Clp protease ATP-binding subunit ClpA
MQMRIPTTIHGSATTSSSALQCARFRSLHSTRLLLSPPRIMAADRVPGVKMPNTGAPVSQNHLNEAAAAGVSRLEAAIKRQAAEKAAKERAAMERMEDIKRAEAQQPQAPQLRLEQMKATLDGSIDGQDLAKDVVARALRRRMMKLDDNERPLRLLFAGPSGVGKTAMATSVCEALLGRCEPDKNFKRFNLSEFSHPSKFNRLTGGDPNYVGYKEGGELTNFIRHAEERRVKKFTGVEHTSCVLLLDEVDRAADGLLTFLMNFLDQGQLTSGSGDTVDARRAVVLMTTNVGQKAIAAARMSAQDGARAGGAAMLPDELTREAVHAAEMARRRRAIVESVRADVLEHICDGRYENLGRLGTIVPFLPLRTEGQQRVVERQLRAVARRLEEAKAPAVLRGWSGALIEHALTHWDDDLGGRSTRDWIDENVVEALAEALDAAPLNVLNGSAPPLDLELDAIPASSPGAGMPMEDDPASRRVVCTATLMSGIGDRVRLTSSPPESSSADEDLPDSSNLPPHWKGK